MSKRATAEEAVELLEEVKSKLKRREAHCHKQMVLDGALWNEEVVSMSMCYKTIDPVDLCLREIVGKMSSRFHVSSQRQKLYVNCSLTLSAND